MPDLATYRAVSNRREAPPARLPLAIGKTFFRNTSHTIGLKAKAAITPVEKAGEPAPDYRMFVSKVEIGAGWARTSKGGRQFVSLKLNDLRFPASIYATLIERDGRHELI